jgi:hypothetical protein
MRTRITPTLLGVVAIAGSLAWTPGASAEYTVWTTSAPVGTYSEVTGRIVSANPDRNEITLDNGVRLRIPERFQDNWGLLKPGAYVRAQYRAEGGELVANVLDIGTAPMASAAGTPARPATGQPAAVVTAPAATVPMAVVPGSYGHVAGRVVESAQVVTLEDGTRLRLGEGSPADWRVLPGTYLQAQYRIVNGERVATAVSVGPTPGTTVGSVTVPPAATLGAVPQGEIAGRVERVSPSKAEVTLDNGVMLRVPSDVQIDWDRLERGSYVKATYRPFNGQNVVTAMQITPAPATR